MTEPTLIAHYEALHDRLSDLIESGRLQASHIPDDYHWLVEQLAQLSGLAEAQPAPTAAYVLIQEGGSSTELYLHAWGSEDEAEQDRISCAKDGAYRTSPVVEVPGDLAAHPGFYETVESILRAGNDLECVDFEEDEVCDICNTVLESGQIGLCDACQEHEHD